MRFHDRPVVADFAAPLAEITNELFTTFELRASGLVTIKIADQTNPERDVVQVIAVNMAAVDLPAPTIADFDLPVPGRSSIADDKVVSEPVLHPAKMSMVVIERSGIALTRAAIVHNDVLPATSRNRRTVDLRPN